MHVVPSDTVLRNLSGVGVEPPSGDVIRGKIVRTSNALSLVPSAAHMRLAVHYAGF